MPEMPTSAHHDVILGEDADARIWRVTVLLMTQREGRSVLGHVVGLYTKLELNTVDRDAPVTYFLSRLQGEVKWVIDAKFGSDGYPHYAHGFGERTSVTRTIVKPVARVLDDLALALGLAEAVGENVPLVLAAYWPTPRHP
ncbi:hypothetical protein ACIRJR_32725 [Streptomyces sp. NPDC102402]|uniref:hypothetical protein n=1 Tax=Streptomyces sp. NPDC102402 TaxID=3366169 RepID=UPI0038187E62